MAIKIDSNDTGLRFAVESALKVLPANPVWYPLEPNSYGDLGGAITTIARNPINPSRQRQKGVVTDLEASASFEMDLTSNNHLHFMQSYLFATAKEPASSQPINSASVGVSISTGGVISVPSTVTSQFSTGDIVCIEGSALGNNGAFVVGTVTNTTIAATGLVSVVEPAGNPNLKITKCGLRTTGAVNVTVTGGNVNLTFNAVDFAKLAFIEPGDWVHVGGSTASSRFVNNYGFARVSSKGTTSLTFDKVTWTPVAETGNGLSVEIYFGTVIKNAPDPANIVRRTLQFERTLGNDNNGLMSQYVTGAVANELTLNIPQAEKITAEFGFIACDSETRPGTMPLKTGSRPAVVKADAFNTSSDVKRIAFSLVGVPTPLFVYATDLSITINNNASGAKAIGVLGNFDVNTGVFDVSGSVTAYFADINAVSAVRNNSDVTFDVIVQKNNNAIIFDIPLLALGNGMLGVEQDQAITVPLDTAAAEGKFGSTLCYVNFPYVPSSV